MIEFKDWHTKQLMEASANNDKDMQRLLWCYAGQYKYGFDAAVEMMNEAALKLPEGDREAIEAFMLAYFSDKTFGNYIRNTLAGDFAHQLAKSLRKLTILENGDTNECFEQRV